MSEQNQPREKTALYKLINRGLHGAPVDHEGCIRTPEGQVFKSKFMTLLYLEDTHKEFVEEGGKWHVNFFPGKLIVPRVPGPNDANGAGVADLACVLDAAQHEGTLPQKAKRYGRSFWYDWDAKRVCSFDLTAGNLRDDDKWVSPLRGFLAHIQKNNIDHLTVCTALSGVLGPEYRGKQWYVIALKGLQQLDASQQNIAKDAATKVIDQVKNQYARQTIKDETPAQGAQVSFGSGSKDTFNDINF